MGDGFDALMDAASPAVRDLAQRSRELIRSVYPDVVEVRWPRQNVVGYGVGPRKMSQHFCTLAVDRDHLNLGFNHGADLPDPDGLLRGPGKRLRHFPVATPADFARFALRRLLEAACRDRLPTTPPSPEPPPAADPHPD